ncbi:MAG TPA: hypothetical protein VGD13_00060, partial [Xanthobacteraceae bacterium]
MVGADPKFQRFDRAGRVISPDVDVRPLARENRAPEYRPARHRLRWIALLSIFVPLSFVLVQCGKAPSAGMLAANSQAAAGDSFDDRFPAPQFRDRFPTA